MNEQFKQNSFLNAENALYIAEQFQRFCKDPKSIPSSWQSFFSGLSDQEKLILLDLSRGSPFVKPKTSTPQNSVPASSAVTDLKEIELTLKASAIADAYRRWGHYSAHLDPLGLVKPKGHDGLETKFHTFKEGDLDRSIKGFQIGRRDTIAGIIEQLSKVYCGKAAYEYMHIPNMEEVNWIKRRLETAPFALSAGDEVENYQWLVKAELFEQFISKKFPGAKRFSVEGCDALIPVLHNILSRAAADAVGNAVIGMAHRGRLNTLYNIMGRSYEELFAKFMDHTPTGHSGSGDVKYHIGASAEMMLHNKPLHVALMYNPSHLEAVNPVAMGNVWAKQQDSTPNALGILVHGDAAFAGQGVNAETLLISQVDGYSVGGMIHIITNNQIGFTATPNESRSTDYSSDLAKSINAPVFHANADDIPACIFVSWLAYSYRQEFKKDVIIDIVGYRRYGHNEGDEPFFTQPVMYGKIKNHPTVLTQYEADLIKKGSLTEDRAKKIRAEYEGVLNAAYEKASTWDFHNYISHKGRWEKIQTDNHRPATGISIDRLKNIGTFLSSAPENFNINSKIARQLATRKTIMESGQGIDWATGELLAYGSLLEDGIPVRLSGEDSVRGTFSHRHVGLYDQETNALTLPVNHLPTAKTKMCVYNSVLSEYAVMGFEYGVALSNPHRLIIWEGQFGDFANGAQIIIDQYIAAAETKWELYNGLVLLLPHGSEGQGPEHSSARLERYLQLCAEENLSVVVPTTPANVFHLFRRQVIGNVRKPLIMLSPKSLLRHKLAVSNLSDMAENTQFMPLIPDPTLSEKTKKIIFCSGKIYYELFEKRGASQDIALVRIEELYPFPHEALKQVLSIAPTADIVWCQEEPQNMGAWTFVYFAMKELGITIRYIGRKSAAAPATGYNSVHQTEQSAILESALSVKGN